MNKNNNMKNTVLFLRKMCHFNLIKDILKEFSDLLINIVILH